MAVGLQKLREEFPARWFLINTAAVGICIFFILLTVEQNLYALNEEAMLKRSLAYQPFNSRLWFSLGMTYIKNENFPVGEAQFRKALDVDPQHVRSHIALGKSLCDQGRFLEGAREYEKVSNAKELKQNLDENKKDAYQHLVREYENKLSAQPNDPEILFSLGIFEAQLGHVQPAMEYFQKVLAINPQHSDALFNTASGFESLNQKGKAHEYYDKFLRIDNTRQDLQEYARVHMRSL